MRIQVQRLQEHWPTRAVEVDSIEQVMVVGVDQSRVHGREHRYQRVHAQGKRGGINLVNVGPGTLLKTNA